MIRVHNDWNRRRTKGPYAEKTYAGGLVPGKGKAQGKRLRTRPILPKLIRRKKGKHV